MQTVREGAVELRVPDQPENGTGASVFYNPAMELNRDVTVAVLRAISDREGTGSYLDAMTASGVRGVRAAAEGWAVTCTDVDPAATALATENLRANGLDADVRTRDAVVELTGSRYDVVDVDPFGTPIPYADAASRAADRLLCVTATDTAPLCGAHFAAGVRRYSAVPRNTEYHAEVGLRVLLSALVRTAARYDVALEPVLSHATRHYVRVYLEPTRRATAADEAIGRLGSIHHCTACHHRETEAGLIAHPPGECRGCGTEAVVTASPLWLGRTRDRGFVRAVRGAVSDELGAAGRARRLLDRLEAELDEPTHYDQHVLSSAWNRTAGPMDGFLAALREAGFEASRAHYGGTTFKTTASVAEIREATA